MSNSELRFKKECLFIHQDEDSDYTNIPLEMAQDNSISIGARGVMCYLLSIPEKQKRSRSIVHETHIDQEEDINSYLDELIEAGYLEEVQQ